MTPELLRIDGMGEGIGSLALSAPARPKAGPRALSVLRITDGAKAHFAARIPGKKIYVTADTLAARSMLSKISSHPDVRAAYVPHRDDVLIHRKGFSLAGSRERAAALAALVSGEADIAVVSADALVQRFPRAELLKRFSVHIEKEGVLSPQDAADRLVAAGYARRDMISEEGEFALRGDILDIYAWGTGALRVNFFD